MQGKIVALVVAGGTGRRAGGPVPKQFAPAGGKALLHHAAKALASHPKIGAVQVVIHPDYHAEYEAAVAGLTLLPAVHGGAERQDSVRLGLKALEKQKPDYVLVHDAARPFLTHAMIDKLIEALTPSTASVPTLPVADTVRRLKDGKLSDVPREQLLRFQTPQAFPFKTLLELHGTSPAYATDDIALWVAAGKVVKYITGSETLRKVTSADDMAWAQQQANGQMRTSVGSGFDVHAFIEGDGVTVGGIAIAHDKKLDGHSDADVALHALVDAMLGALSEGDIGQHFPPNDARWKGADSAVFVREALKKMHARGGSIEQADITIICEAPKIGPHRDAMRANIAQLLEVPLDYVSVKATTTEQLGFTGRREGMAAQATVTLRLPRGEM